MKRIFERGGNIRQFNGEAGYGVYAYVAPSNAMKKYYTGNGETLYKIIPKDDAIFLDFTNDDYLLNMLIDYMREHTKKMGKEMQFYTPPKINKANYQRYGNILEEFIMNNYSDVDGWIVQHKGIGIPTGKQVVIRNLDSVNIL